jgi:hypothetical protein
MPVLRWQSGKAITCQRQVNAMLRSVADKSTLWGRAQQIAGQKVEM